MIKEALDFLADGLRAGLRRHQEDGVTKVEIAAPAPTGRRAEDGVYMALINLEREAVAANSSQVMRRAGEGYRASHQPLNLNLVVMVYVNYPDKYKTSLRLLSDVVAYFQSMPVLTPQNTPPSTPLPTALARLSVEWRETDLQAIHNIWTSFGSTYLPSAIYLVRMLVVDDLGRGVTTEPITTVAVE